MQNSEKVRENCTILARCSMQLYTPYETASHNIPEATIAWFGGSSAANGSLFCEGTLLVGILESSSSNMQGWVPVQEWVQGLDP